MPTDESKVNNEEKKTEEKKLEGMKSEEKKPEEKKPDLKKPEEKKPEEKKPDEKKLDEKKPEEKKPDEKKPEEKKPDEKKPDEKKPEVKKPEGMKADEKKPDEKKPEGKKPDDKKPEDKKKLIEDNKNGKVENGSGPPPPTSPKGIEQPKPSQPSQPQQPKQETMGAPTSSDPPPPPKKEPDDKFQGFNARLGFAVAAAALGSAFQHGYNLGVINAPLNLIGNWLNETNYERYGEYRTETSKTFIVSILVSIYCIGGMIGGALTGTFSERFGRKGGLLLNNIFAVIAAILFGFCQMAGSHEMIIAARFVIGINNGLNAGLAPMYLSEIAPINLRGAIGTVYQLVVTISILFSQIMGLDSILGTASLWPVLLALTILPAIFQLATLPCCPESPKFLLINKDEPVAAQRALTWLRDTSNVQDEMGEMRNEAEANKLVPSISLREILTNPTLRIPLVISMMMMLAQQLSGINAVIFFSTKIYASAGLSEEASLNATIAMGAMNVLMTVASLIMVEKFGRKTLMLAGLFGMMVDVFLLFICLLLKDYGSWISYFSIFLVIFFVVMFATGPGSIPWFLVTEVFASNARPMASSIAVAVNWTAAFLVGLGFLPIQELIGPYVFLIFVGILAGFIVFTWKKVPETKGKTIDEITAVFKQTAYGANSV